MRGHQLLHELVSRFAPMDDSTKTELQTSAITYYGQLQEDLRKRLEEIATAKHYNELESKKDEPVYETVPTLDIKHKIIQFIENPLARYLFAIIYIWAVPKIKSFMNGGGEDEDFDEDEDEGFSFEDFKEFKRFQKTMR